jgi:hypothetical protein
MAFAARSLFPFFRGKSEGLFFLSIRVKAAARREGFRKAAAFTRFSSVRYVALH